MPAGQQWRRRSIKRCDWEDRAEDVERGLRLIPRLGEVMPEEAGEEVRAVYEAVRTRLRVPFVNFIFRMLANYPPYLSFAWNKIEPHLLTLHFEEAADALRARALVEPVPDAAGVDWAALGDLGQIRGFTDTIHYVLPKLLLVASALDEGLGGEPGAANGSEAGILPGVAEGTISLSMVATHEVTGRIKEIFEEIRERHGHPDVASYYRGIAHWPKFLEAAWERVSSLVGTAPYQERKHDLLAASRSAVLELPLPSRSEALQRGLTEEQVEELRAILAVFRFRIISDMFLDVPLIKALLDGPGAARYSRFSFAAR
ncbi:MAG: halocarboxylic acid dehydrogenase DehI family protein [Actinomycetota bacterium]|nr:halocarboxylic acid dehydrogenase DehI family protein [Actinomycetota bacterium]